MTTLISYANAHLAQCSLRTLGMAASLALISYSSTALAHGHEEKAQGQAQYAHVHGVVQLDIAADGTNLVLQLTAPQADITGFEHQAKTDAEKQTVTQAIDKLKLSSLFVLNANAACKLADTDIDGLGPDSHAVHAKPHAHSHETDTKAKDHGDAEHAHGHNDVSVTWQWHCERLQQLDAIDVQLAKQFSSIHTINVQMAMPQGQFSRTLKSGETRLTWK